MFDRGVQQQQQQQTHLLEESDTRGYGFLEYNILDNIRVRSQRK